MTEDSILDQNSQGGRENKRPSAKVKVAAARTSKTAALLLGICLISSATSLICRREVDFGRQLPDFSTSALHDLSLSVIAYSLLLDHGSGTAYLKTSSLHGH